MIVVTGGAGFIGSNLVSALNRRGVRDILVVDDVTDAAKARNLFDLQIGDYMDKAEFLDAIRSERPDPSLQRVSAVLHQGACTDTMATDGKYVLDNNYAYSRALYYFCAQRRAQYIYASSASVYGHGTRFAETPRNESALNAYAWSKLLFDQFVRRQPVARPPQFQCVGLRYFNVYGRRERHKGRMASVAWHFFNQYMAHGRVRLFEGSDGYADGEQQRDFVSVEDVVAVNLFLLDNPAVSGIYNVGSGCSCSFNRVAVAVINACRRHRRETEITLEQARRGGQIAYIPMPETLRGKYQSYTCADLRQLRAAGYGAPFLDVPQGVGGYVSALLQAPDRTGNVRGGGAS
ncbi:MAG: ADP-glyceromanno-heptose 6-epimerase [Gammaproteobacteria bacterium]|nr:ADP-glyceromanno-heptose 6-epimerase [Gammaproteobacteria bacterium]